MAETNPFSLYRLSDLTDEQRQPPEFIVEGMIPVGLSFLSGAPKTRKSFLALQLANCVARGDSFFGFRTKQCGVVYFDLEGSTSRVSSRVESMGLTIPDNLYFTHSLTHRLADNLTEDLRSLHRSNPSIRLVIIDTYSRSRGSVSSGGLNAYDADVQLLEPVQRVAVDEKIAILFVHHLRKGASAFSDPFEGISGSMGISGSCDSVLNLVTDGSRFNGNAKLVIVPRDAAGGEMNLFFDGVLCQWTVRTSDALLGNPLVAWILSHAPEPQHEAFFISYKDLFEQSFRFSTGDEGEQIQRLLSPLRDELFNTKRIGIQLGVRSNSKRGIRIINLK